MIDEPLDEAYFKWLAVQVVNTRLRNPTTTNWFVLRQLYVTEFVWRIRNDDNRVEDGKELRLEFLEQHPQFDWSSEWTSLGCSFLEMLIALSRRLSFQSELASSAGWFWHMMDNVNLNIFDYAYERDRMHGFVDQVLQSLNNRTYERNGRGGLFPLHDDSIDQTQIEIWYQMNYYLLERS